MKIVCSVLCSDGYYTISISIYMLFSIDYYRPIEWLNLHQYSIILYCKYLKKKIYEYLTSLESNFKRFYTAKCIINYSIKWLNDVY